MTSIQAHDPDSSATNVNPAPTQQTGGGDSGGSGGRETGPAVRFPPPAIFVLLIVAGALLQLLVPLSTGLPDSLRYAGLAFSVLGIIAISMVFVSFKQADTAIEPWKPATTLVVSGLFRWSRNPIYTGFCLINSGVGITADNLWILLSFIPGALLVYHLAIAKEERYLEQKFGQDYIDYKARVRRWI